LFVERGSLPFQQEFLLVIGRSWGMEVKDEPKTRGMDAVKKEKIH
jgi:hypothetical protein